MTDYREILRLSAIGLTRTSIGEALGYSRNTVADVLRRAKVKGVAEQIPDGMSDRQLAEFTIPREAESKEHANA